MTLVMTKDWSDYITKVGEQQQKMGSQEPKIRVSLVGGYLNSWCVCWRNDMAYWPNCRTKSGYSMLFPRRSERRILLIVGVCYTSSHLHLHIYADHLHIFTSTQIIFTSSQPHICTSSQIFSLFSLLHIFSSLHLHILSLALSFSLSFSLSLSPPLSLSCPLALCHGLFLFLFSL